MDKATQSDAGQGKTVYEIVIGVDEAGKIQMAEDGYGYRDKYVEWSCSNPDYSFALLFKVAGMMPFKDDANGGYADPGGEICFKVKKDAPTGFPYKYAVIVQHQYTGAIDVVDPKFIVKG